MPAFSLNNLKPADSIEGLGKAKADRGGSKQAALRNIDEQLKLLDPKKDGNRTFWDTVREGKRSYTGEGAHIGFSVKVGSTKLLLGSTQEPYAAKGEFEQTLRGIRAEIDKGALDDQLAKLDAARAGRVDKMRATRAGKKADKPKV